jgi:hypothetical protein
MIFNNEIVPYHFLWATLMGAEKFFFRGRVLKFFRHPYNFKNKILKEVINE